MDRLLKSCTMTHALASAQKLHLNARELNPKITLKKVQDWLNSHSNVQRFQEQKPVFQQFRIASSISDPLFSNKTPRTWMSEL
ncbi:LOW QUALITY PROTEIN: Hypothetical protein PHPALM_36981 [Phytophthora palmivora]|uniref:Uncharacterized protein n=1 Tax=Phytophthora palmivora TaxID=4796 RepID=A0A2P4WYJ9_9STRA|nr:LOW QUALITY PROTEIN: Hypothetical protein PHPALM_36981 [Phytophthora palmivora]